MNDTLINFAFGGGRRVLRIEGGLASMQTYSQESGWCEREISLSLAQRFLAHPSARKAVRADNLLAGLSTSCGCSRRKESQS